jgi:hypothetical protein
LLAIKLSSIFVLVLILFCQNRMIKTVTDQLRQVLAYN